MTRLTTNDITDMSAWAEYERHLCASTGESLFSLTALTLGLDLESAQKTVRDVRVAAVPISSGEGLISGFADSLVSIAQHLGFTAAVMEPDAKGFAQAHATDHDLVIWADDTTYLAENLHTGFQAENGQATGAGFATALLCLRRMVTGAPDRDATGQIVVVLGCGPVGLSGARTLLRYGAEVVLCDLDRNKARQVARLLCAETGKEPHVCAVEELSTAVSSAASAVQTPSLSRISCLLDAAPTDGCFPLVRMEPGACIAAPCVPCSWPASFRLWHDPLQLGTAVMLLSAALEQRIG